MKISFAEPLFSQDIGTEAIYVPTRLAGIEPLGNIPLGPVAKFRDARAPAETMV